MKSMAREVLSTIWIWVQIARDVLYIGSGTCRRILRTTVINMNMSVHIATDHWTLGNKGNEEARTIRRKVAYQHWSTIIGRPKLSTVDFKYRAVLPVYRPSCSRHWPVARFMFLLVVSWKPRLVNHPIVPKCTTLPRGRVQKYPQSSQLVNSMRCHLSRGIVLLTGIRRSGKSFSPDCVRDSQHVLVRRQEWQ